MDFSTVSEICRSHNLNSLDDFQTHFRALLPAEVYHGGGM